MNIKSYYWLWMGVLIFVSCSTKKSPSLVSDDEILSLVNPFIGTSSEDGGRTSPGAMRPNGMVTLAPTNILRDTLDSTGPTVGYVHGNENIFGFSHVNLNGIGCHEASSITLMPYRNASYYWLHDNQYR